MFADLCMLMDTFVRRQAVCPNFLIKTHPHQLSAVQSFIAHYTRAHPAVSIAAKGTPYLIKGEYDIHIRPPTVVEVAVNPRHHDERVAA